MMCEHPFIRDWSKVKRIGEHVIGGSEERLAATPLPCGRCLACRINKRREWTHRIMLENHMHGDSVFVTLTLSDWHVLKRNGDLLPKDCKNFLSRLRRRLKDAPFRYFFVGEYGADQRFTERPHYHAILFGLSSWHETAIRSAWSVHKRPFGIVDLGEVNQYSAQYIAGYTTKKLTKEGDPYLKGRKPEFMRSSRKDGGIGLSYIKKLGEQLKKEKFWEPRIINQLTWGKKQWPLGRYLTDKLAEYSGVSAEERERNLVQYQNGIFNRHLDSTKWFPGEVINENIQPRKNQKRWYNIRNDRGYVDCNKLRKHKVKRMVNNEARKV